MNCICIIALIAFLLSGQTTDLPFDHWVNSAIDYQTNTGCRQSAFWRWFQEHETALLAVKTGGEPICTELEVELHKIHPDLTFEIGPVNNGRREFVISADGLLGAFPSVVHLAKAAPSLPRWKVTQFRPRTAPMRVAMNGCTIDPETVDVLIRRESGKIALTISVPGYRSTQTHDFEQIGYVLLDHALGEYIVGTRIGAIDFVARDKRPKGPWHSLRELAKIVDPTPNT